MSFDDNGNRQQSVVRILQYRNGEFVTNIIRRTLF